MSTRRLRPQWIPAFAETRCVCLIFRRLEYRAPVWGNDLPDNDDFGNDDCDND
ncbi:MAG: hypothetical protein NXI32_31185 [bacterium]|nr:hypothetical protein [bacterium]